ncbi:hypothetical protein SZ63_05710 [Methanoculleus sediminis]|uniref:BIG2 domain-containing protein n=1 Tax=Methanoculleus sediminis TaxID=1550566 RepID=A0A0H1R0Z8_9EURY|nr:Ig-like domain-containing protein [Methanoculleus sediminis]KLK88506.1 hypothetical protein SZ63_05710 [Methanoculleus sediminis]
MAASCGEDTEGRPMIIPYALIVACFFAFLLFPGGVVQGSAVAPAVDSEPTGNLSPEILTHSRIPENLSLSPDAGTLALGDAPLQFTATLSRANYTADVTGNCNWSSSNTSVGTVEGGIFTPGAPGHADVTASYPPNVAPGRRPITATAPVVVSPPSRRLTTIIIQPPVVALDAHETRELEATCLDENDNPIADVAVSWESSDEAIAAVDAGGTVTGVSEGSAEITASVEGVVESAIVQVNRSPPVPAAIEVSPQEERVGVEDTLQLNASCSDQYGEVMPDVTMTWSSSDAAIGSVDFTGLFHARAGGTAIVTASADGARGSATITVIESTPEPETPTIVTELPEPEPAFIAVSPSSGTLGVGETVRLEAAVYDRNNREIPGTPVSWASANESVGTIDDEGLFTAVAEGETVVTARSGEIEGGSNLRVARESLIARIEVQPESCALEVDRDRQLTATCYDRDGRVVEGADVAWTCSNVSVGSVNGAGLFTARNAGNVTINATADGVAGSATVVVGGSPSPVDPVLLAILAVVTGATASYGIQRYLKGRPRTRIREHLPVHVEVGGGVEAAKAAPGSRPAVDVEVTGGIQKGGEER